MTPGTDAQRPSGQGVIAIPIVDGHRGGVRPGRWPSAEELSALGHVLVPRPIREQAVIPHAVEAAREHMQEDAPDELRRGQGHGLLTRCVGTAVVGVAEPDLPRVEGEEPLGGYRPTAGAVASGIPIGDGEGLCETASSWRLLTGRLAPRFRHRSYSTTSEEPPPSHFNSYWDIPGVSASIAPAAFIVIL